MAIWQTISETLADEIGKGVLQSGGRLPSDGELAVRFGVHRHTVRKALTELQARGLVRTERGRGTFVVEDAIAYRLGAQTRFEENIAEHTRMPSRRLIATAELPAPPEIAEPLSVAPGRNVFTATLLGEADGWPIHVFRAHFSPDRTPEIAQVFDAVTRDATTRLSLEDLLTKAGVPRFQRKTARIRCRLPDAEEARLLKMAPREPVFETEILNIDERDHPVFFGVTTMCGGRIEFVFDF